MFMKIGVKAKGWMWLYNVMFMKIGVNSKRMDVIISSNDCEDRC